MARRSSVSEEYLFVSFPVPPPQSLMSAPEKALASEQLVPLQNIQAVAKNIVSLAPVRPPASGRRRPPTGGFGRHALGG